MLSLACLCPSVAGRRVASRSRDDDTNQAGCSCYLGFPQRYDSRFRLDEQRGMRAQHVIVQYCLSRIIAMRSFRVCSNVWYPGKAGGGGGGLYLVAVRKIQMTTPLPPPPNPYWPRFDPVMQCCIFHQHYNDIVQLHVATTNESKASQTVVQIATPSPPPLLLPPQLAYLLHSFRNYSPSSHWCPRNAIRPSTIYRIC